MNDHLASYAVESLQEDKELLFEVATRHFVKQVTYLPSLVKALSGVLNLRQG
jgi:hypothetical protein